MKYKFFDSSHVKADNTWYKTDKCASAEVLTKFVEDGHIDGAVVTALPDDNFEEIVHLIKEFCPPLYIIRAVTPIGSSCLTSSYVGFLKKKKNAWYNRD